MSNLGVSVISDSSCLIVLDTHHFSGCIPFAVKPRIYSRPFPTSPKLAGIRVSEGRPETLLVKNALKGSEPDTSQGRQNVPELATAIRESKNGEYFTA